MSACTGRVTLVGAGPGDPELLTVRAVNRLADADLVLYDALSSPRARALAPEARWFYVGKRARRESMNQDTINRVMIREARRGRHVVRLKSGDPYVLGRGGEEALAMAEAQVPCEVVPGLSTALAAPALLGIPLTHRGLATGFVVVSGHAESAWQALVDGWSGVGSTLVVLMGLGARQSIAQRLLARGIAGTTPAAIVLNASGPEEKCWVGTLAAWVGDGADAHALAAWAATAAGGLRPGELPGVLVLGDVVTLSSRLRGPQAASAAQPGEPAPGTAQDADPGVQDVLTPPSTAFAQTR